MFARAVIFALAGLAGFASHAQRPAAQPTRPIVLVVPAPEGGSAHAVARRVAAMLADELKQPVAVRAEPANGGVTALNLVYEGAGGELLIALATNTAFAAGRMLPRGARFNPAADFDWLGVVGAYPNAIVVRNDAPAISPRAWLEKLRALGRPAAYGVQVAGAANQMAGRYIEREAGISLAFVTVTPDQGYTALRRGEIDFVIDGMPNFLEERGRNAFQIVAVTSARRLPAFPTVPALAEALPGPEFKVFTALAVSKREPEELRDHLAAAWERARTVPANREALTQLGLDDTSTGRKGALDAVEAAIVGHAALMARFLN